MTPQAVSTGPSRRVLSMPRHPKLRKSGHSYDLRNSLTPAWMTWIDARTWERIYAGRCRE